VQKITINRIKFDFYEFICNNDLILSLSIASDFMIRRRGMDVLYLPYVEYDDSLRTAIQRMKASDCRWVVVRYQDSQYKMHDNQVILDARTKGIESCAGLQDSPGELLAFLADDLAQNQAGSIWELVEGALDRKGASYGLPFGQFPGNHLIAVVTRHEGDGALIRNTDQVCGCEQGHPYSQPPPVDGTLCQHDNTLITCI
jgi:hypothetical protein